MFAVLLGWIGHGLAVKWPAEPVFCSASLEGNVLVLSGHFISSDGTRQQDRQIRMDLEHGEVTWESPRWTSQPAGSKYAIRRKSSAGGNLNQTQQQFLIERTNQNNSTPVKSLDSFATPLVMGDMVVSISDEGVSVDDLSQPTQPPLRWKRTNNSRQIDLLPTKSENQFVVMDHANGTLSSEIYRIKDGTLEIQKSWKNARSSIYYSLSDKDVFLIEEQDGTREILTLEADSFRTVNLNAAIDLVGKRCGIQPTADAIMVVDGLNRTQLYDVETLVRLPSPKGTNLDNSDVAMPARDRKQGLLYYGDTKKVVCIHETDGKTLWTYSPSRFEVRDKLSVKLLLEQRLLVHSQFPRPFAAVLDRSTGAELRRLDPLYAIEWKLIFWLILAILWSAILLVWSVRESGWAWIDCCFILVLAVGSLVYRGLVSGIAEQADRIEYRIAMGLSAGGLGLSCFWFVFGSTRWTLRVIPLIGCLAFVCGMTSIPFGVRSWAGSETLVGMLLAILWMCTIFTLARLRGVNLFKRISKDDQPESEAGDHSTLGAPSKRRRQRSFPLRDVFLLTLVIAILFATIRALPVPSSRFISLELIVLNATAIFLAFNMLVAIQSALTDRVGWPRYLWILVAPALGAIGTMGHSYWFSIDGWNGWHRFAPFHMTIACVSAAVVFGLMHAFRWRNWRLGLNAD